MNLSEDIFKTFYVIDLYFWDIILRSLLNIYCEN